MRAVLAPEALEAIVDVLRRRDWRVVAPTVRDKAIVYGEIASAAELPVGWKDVQAPGSYQLERRDDEARFGYAVGPQSWKRELLAPSVRLLQIERANGSFKVAKDAAETKRTAFFGVRPCEVAAIKIQDRVLVGGPFVDEDYLARRKNSFIDRRQLRRAGGELLLRLDGHRPQGRGRLRPRPDRDPRRHAPLPGRVRHRRGRRATGRAPAAGGRRGRPGGRREGDRRGPRDGWAVTLDRSDVHELLLANLEHPRYDDVAARCLACTNCTLACPTCFCTTVDDANSLSGEGDERIRRWDSCFNASVLGDARRRHAPLAAVPLPPVADHKLATWHDQFDTQGCVGCGRCITWCPVGIDIREEVAAIRATQEAKS